MLKKKPTNPLDELKHTVEQIAATLHPAQQSRGSLSTKELAEVLGYGERKVHRLLRQAKELGCLECVIGTVETLTGATRSTTKFRITSPKKT